jgi:phosphatidylglycerol---prolipoprotein diacylglyceryl transferase
MFNFLHNFEPSPLIISLGPINVYWYGLFVVLGTMAGLTVALKLAKKFNLSQETIFDLSFWLIIWGLVGARLYHVFLEWDYYGAHPLNILKIWQGGLAIHGGIIASLLVIVFYAWKNKINFWVLAGPLAPALAIGQAIGRWGNYFNQELFGKPTDLLWGIPIDLINRPHFYLSDKYFHPTFLYESLGDLLIFGILLWLIFGLAAKKEDKTGPAKIVLLAYLIFYSVLRFSLEFLRTDRTAYLFGWRWPQIASLLIFVVAAALLFWPRKKRETV